MLQILGRTAIFAFRVVTAIPVGICIALLRLPGDPFDSWLADELEDWWLYL